LRSASGGALGRALARWRAGVAAVAAEGREALGAREGEALKRQAAGVRVRVRARVRVRVRVS